MEDGENGDDDLFRTMRMMRFLASNIYVTVMTWVGYYGDDISSDDGKDDN